MKQVLLQHATPAIMVMRNKLYIHQTSGYSDLVSGSDVTGAVSQYSWETLQFMMGAAEGKKS